MIRRSALLSFVLAMGYAGAAVAAPVFTVKVPIQVSAIPSMAKSIRLYCTLNGPNPTTGVEGVLKIREMTIPLDASGGYSGTVTVAWDRSEFSDLERTILGQIKTGTCSMSFMVPGQSGSVSACAEPPSPMAAKPGTTCTDEVGFIF